MDLQLRTGSDTFTFDRNTKRETRREQQHFAHVRRSEREYARQLRAVARHVGELVKQLLPGKDASLQEIESARFQIDAVMSRYSASLRPWAEVVSKRMLQDVMRRDEAAWAKHSQGMARALREEVRTTPTGQWFTNAMAEQVRLITSLPLDASKRVHERVLRAQETGMRAEELAEELAATGQVTRSRAALIARTETARASSNLTQARAMHIGSEGYIWRTAGDADVRAVHKKLNGKFFRWDDPPVAGEKGERAHAGGIYNCRCVAEPVVPEEIQ